MTRRFLLPLVLVATGLLLGGVRAEDPDLIIRGGRVIDGTGNPAYFADVAVRNGRITAIGRGLQGTGQALDAKGLVVAPGFIDVHTHAENIAEIPRAENFVRMGVTSIVTGNCGGSALNVERFFRAAEAAKVSVNVATLFGHNTARRSAMGGTFRRDPTGAELARMTELVEQAMKDGAVGLSTGLIYTPGTYSKTEEIIPLARVAAKYDGIYASHMRSESTGIFDALQELFRIAREAGIRADISHLKLAGNASWGKSGAVLAAIEGARAEGLDITHDQYAYTASSTGISTLIPSEYREGGGNEFRERLADPARKAEIVAAMKESLQRSGRSDYAYAAIASYRADRSLNGKRIPEAARIKRGSDSLEDQIELVLEIQQNGGASGVFHGMSEEDLQAFMRHPNTMVASDGGPRVKNDTVPHPRSYGNNARVLARYVRELKLLRLEDAIRKMTSLPASTFRLKDRGLIREGGWADLVVFDPEKVRDVATFEDPHHHAEGMVHVLVNGVPVLRGGEQTGVGPGMALRHASGSVPVTRSR